MKVGDKAFEFSGMNHEGKTVVLGDFAGKWLVLYFYPKDNTPGCTIEGIDFTALRGEFEKLGAVVVGVSADSVASHCKFIEKKNLGIMLLADEDRKIIEGFGVWRLKKFMGREFMGIVRSTFLIDPTGKIAHMWDPVRVKGHAQEVLDTLRGLV